MRYFFFGNLKGIEGLGGILDYSLERLKCSLCLEFVVINDVNIE